MVTALRSILPMYTSTRAANAAHYLIGTGRFPPPWFCAYPSGAVARRSLLPGRRRPLTSVGNRRDGVYRSVCLVRERNGNQLKYMSNIEYSGGGGGLEPNVWVRGFEGSSEEAITKPEDLTHCTRRPIAQLEMSKLRWLRARAAVGAYIAVAEFWSVRSLFRPTARITAPKPRLGTSRG